MRTLVLLSVLGIVAMAAACSDGGDAAGAPEYRVTVRFNTTVTQAGQEEASEILAAYDDKVVFLIQESFPPTGVATLRTNEPDFCSKVQADFAGKTYVDGLDCGPPPATSENPEEPVSREPEFDEGSGPLYLIQPRTEVRGIWGGSETRPYTSTIAVCSSFELPASICQVRLKPDPRVISG